MYTRTMEFILFMFSFRLSRKTRREASSLWRRIFIMNEMALLPEQLVNEYESIYRSILSEMASFHIDNNCYHVNAGMSVDLSGYMECLKSTTVTDIDDMAMSAERGSTLAQEILYEMESPSNDDDDITTLFHDQIATSLMTVMPDINSLKPISEAIFEDFLARDISDALDDKDGFFSIRPNFTRMVFTDDCNILDIM